MRYLASQATLNMAGPACNTLKPSPARRAHASLLLILLATATSIHAAAQDIPAVPSTNALSSSNASYDTAGNPDYYTFDLGTTSAGTAGGEVYVICVNPWPPFVFYNSSTNTLNGYEWDLFLAVSQAMGFSFSARVMGYNEMMHQLALDPSDPKHCDIAPSAISVTPDLLPLTGPKKAQFSIPTYHSGYSIATAVTWAGYDMWSFGRVFTAELWAVLLGTAAVLALLTYAAELDYAKRGLGKTKYPTAFRPGMYEAVYNCVGKLFNVVQDLKVTSLAGKLISIGWGFLVLVASTTYTAGVTATLTSANFKTTISGVADLTHYRVITWDVIARNFLKYGFLPKGMPWLTETEGEAMLAAVARGAADALVVDSPWLRYKLATRCDLVLVGKLFHYIDNAVGFNPHLPASFISSYNAQLVTLKQAGMYEEYQDKYFRASQCPSLVGTQTVVTFKQLKGLWIILGSFVGLAIILLILPHISRRFDPDIKRTSSMFGIKRIGKSIARMATRRAQPDPGVLKAVELQSSKAQDEVSTYKGSEGSAGAVSSLPCPDVPDADLVMTVVNPSPRVLGEAPAYPIDALPSPKIIPRPATAFVKAAPPDFRRMDSA